MYCVFPTPVGVFLGISGSGSKPGSLPHARGGVSERAEALKTKVASSPRPWGCFWFALGSFRVKVVFPTPVGVFLI
ncbi:conserved hypothetical protein [methanotrophic bacterial endosymbiont of Bathymodiolus sp.]|nr:conserved hypothetical protein [methanotrophic bacterial endosymbiont of Bathymodiolus sp.]